jgi:hypothetical protein
MLRYADLCKFVTHCFAVCLGCPRNRASHAQKKIDADNILNISFCTFLAKNILRFGRRNIWW